MQITLTTLSPVHVGSGEQYDTLPLYFAAENGTSRCHVIDVEKLVAGLGPDGVKRFSRWMDVIADEFRNAERDNRLVAKVRERFTVESFLRDEMRLAKPAYHAMLTARENIRYSMDVRSRARGNRNVNRQIATPKMWPYIPGTSIKGALRTALASSMLMAMKESDRDAIFREAARFIRGRDRRDMDQAEELVMKALFNCGTSKNWQNYDLLRFVSVADCFGSKVPSELCQVSSITRKRNRDTGRTEMGIFDLDIFEVIPEKARFIFTMSIDLDQLRAVASRGTGWDRLDSLFSLAFGVELKEALAMDPVEAQKTLVGKLLERASSHGAMVLKEDIAWAVRLFGEGSQARAAMETVKPGPGLFRLGYASGFLADTVYDVARQTDDGEELYKKIFRVTGLDIRRKRGEPDRKIPDLVFERFPASRRMVTGLLQGKMAPLGWARLAME